MREVIARIVDGSDFTDFGARYGGATVCGDGAHPRLAASALSATTARSIPPAPSKATHFIQACCQAGTPLLYLNNTTGYMVGHAL